MENGLEVASKKFDEIKRIHLLEFVDSDEKLLILGECPEGNMISVIWDLYNTGKVESDKLDNFTITTRSARTSGNILQIDDNGKVSSVLKRVEEKLKSKKIDKTPKHKCNSDFKPVNDDMEPWVLGNFKGKVYCLNHTKEGTNTLQLVVGRSTVQIWHQIQDDSKNENDLPNKGEPFLEYIWTNRIPVNQESEITRLWIEKFEYGQNDESHDKLSDFYLKVYWYIIRNNDDEKENIKKTVNVKKTGHEIIEEDNEIHRIEKEFKKINENSEIDEKVKDNMKQEVMKNSKKLKKFEKIIKRKDIVEKFHAVRHACKALEHLNKRYKSKRLANNYVRVHKVSRFSFTVFFRKLYNLVIDIFFN
jgi:hypothetical protein